MRYRVTVENEPPIEHLEWPQVENLLYLLERTDHDAYLFTTVEEEI